MTTFVNITTLTLHVQTSCFPHLAYSEFRSRLALSRWGYDSVKFYGVTLH